MTKIVVGLYEEAQNARRVVSDLEKNGFTRQDINLVGPDQGSSGMNTGLASRLTRAGVPDQDARAYAEGVNNGESVVWLNAPDHRADEAAEIMERYHPVDIGSRLSGRYREEGMSRGTMSGQTGAEYREEFTGRESTTGGTGYRESGEFDREGESHIPIVEEEMNVGKRQVQRGGVRMHTYVTEKPVEETYNVRDETVNVERRPADRPLREGDLDAAFQEQTFEVTETDEELVTDKRANVVEDVVIRKDVEERPETVRDTLRRTEVETENLGQRTTRGRDFNAFGTDFRNHYQTSYGSGGRNYDYYQPAYRYGYDLAGNQRYRGRTWTEIEPEARREWESSHKGSAWSDFKDSIRYAWERATGGAQQSDTSDTGTFSRGSDEGYAAGTSDRR